MRAGRKRVRVVHARARNHALCVCALWLLRTMESAKAGRAVVVRAAPASRAARRLDADMLISVDDRMDEVRGMCASCGVKASDAKQTAASMFSDAIWVGLGRFGDEMLAPGAKNTRVKPT